MVLVVVGGGVGRRARRHQIGLRVLLTRLLNNV